jgi:hypothetical protein
LTRIVTQQAPGRSTHPVIHNPVHLYAQQHRFKKPTQPTFVTTTSIGKLKTISWIISGPAGELFKNFALKQKNFPAFGN